MTSPESHTPPPELISVNETIVYRWTYSTDVNVGYLSLNPAGEFQKTIDEEGERGRWVDTDKSGSIMGAEFFWPHEDGVNLTGLPNSEILIEFFTAKGIAAKIDSPSNS